MDVRPSTYCAVVLDGTGRLLDIAVDTKKCAACKETKRLENFYKYRPSRDGRNKWCRDCALRQKRLWREQNRNKVRREVYEKSLLRNYGITLTEYEEMFVQQQGRCAICGEPESAQNRDGSPRRLHVDHDHHTGMVRSLLCSACNVVLGYVEAHPRRAPNVIEYVGGGRKKPS
jgi:hypothetical protein